MKPIFFLFALIVIATACTKISSTESPTLKVTLIAPTDGSTVVNTKATQFSWSASASNTSVPVTQKITIVEINGTQSPVEAMHTNKPYFEKDSCCALTMKLNYPLTALSPGFTTDKKYAWQVTASQKGLTTTGNTSAVSTFTATH